MKDALQKDSLLTMLGFAVITGAFLFAFYLPELKVNAQIQREIKAAEAAIQDIPLRVAEIEALKSELERRKTFLRQARVWVPVDPDVHSVIHQVAELARNSSLQITRLDPRAPIPFETFQQIPFRLSVSGSFRELTTFLKGLESSDRLFTVQEFTIKQKDGKSASVVEADMHFSVLIGHADFAGFSEKDESSDSGQADKHVGVPSLHGEAAANHTSRGFD